MGVCRGKMKALDIEVTGMSCGGCVKKITDHFQSLAGVDQVQVELDQQKIKMNLEDNVSNMRIRNDLIELGFQVTKMTKV
jgi:copper chaperone